MCVCVNMVSKMACVVHHCFFPSAGIANLRSLQECIQWQKIAYDFQFYPVELNTSLGFLVVSEGRSMLQTDVAVPLDLSRGELDCAFDAELKVRAVFGVCVFVVCVFI